MLRNRKKRGYGKRFLTVLLALAMIVSLTPSLGALTGGALGAQEAHAADYMYFQVDLFDFERSEESDALDHDGYDGGVAVAGYHGGGGYGMDAVIPEEIEYDGKTYKVTMIKKDAFYGTDITSVMIPDSVYKVCTGAFTNCTALKDIYILGYEKELQEHCFGYNYNALHNTWSKIDGVNVHSDFGTDSFAGIYCEENGFNFTDDALVVKQVDITISEYAVPDYGDTVVTPSITINSVSPAFMSDGIILRESNSGWYNSFPYGSKIADGDTFYSGTASLHAHLTKNENYYYKFLQGQTQVTINGEPADDSMWADSWMVTGKVYTIADPGYVAAATGSLTSRHYGTVSFDDVNYDTYKDGNFAAGKPLTIYAKPDEGSEFVEWRKVANYGSAEGDVVGTDPELTITPVSNEEAYYYAMFTKGVSTSGQATETVNYTFDESTGTLTFTPKSGSAELDFSSPADSTLYGVSKVRHVVIGEGITSINNYLLNKATGVEDVTLPASLEYISDMAFEIPVSEFIVASGNTAYKAVDGSLFSKDGATMIRYAQKTPGEDYAIPDGVNYIYRYCFNGQSFGTITLRGNNLVVDDYALTCDYDHIIIENGVKEIRNYHDAPKQDTVISIPASVEWVGTSGGILNGENLEAINVDPANTNLESIDGVLYSKQWDWLEKYPAGRRDTSYTVSDRYPDIAQGAFDSTRNLKEVILPENIGTVYQYAFADNDGLTIIVKGMDTEFYSYAVYNCENTKIRAYEGSKAQSYATGYSIPFEVLPIPVDDAKVTLPKASMTYTGKALTQEPTVEVTFNGETKTLEKGTDYTVSYKNNTNAGNATVVVKGSGKYGGTVSATFKITPAKVTAPTAKTGLIYSGKSQTGVAAGTGYTVKNGSAVNAGNYTATLTLKDKTNYTWSDGTIKDKTVKWTIAPVKVTVPTAKTGLVYTGKAQTGVAAGTNYTVTGGSATNAGTYTATAALKSKTNYTWSDGTTADKKIQWTIKPVALATAKLNTTVYSWNGAAKKPAATVTAKVSGATKTLKAGTDYTVTYKNNKNVGKAAAIIKGTGNYSGTKTMSFKINPKGTTLKAAKNYTVTKTAVTAKWAAQSNKMSASRITGYEVQIATNKGFTAGKKSAKVKGYSSISKKFTKLKSGKKYYVRIRTYKTVNGAAYYSPWSAVKTVTTKK